MSDEHIIDVVEPCRFRRGHDSVGITAVEPGPAGIDQQGLAVWVDDQRSLTALDVDEVDIERLGVCNPGLSNLGCSGNKGKHKQTQDQRVESGMAIK